MDLKGQYFLVTGANKGIGFAAVRQLAARGATVFLGSRDVERGNRAAATLKAQDLDVRPVQLDVTDKKSVQGAVSAVEKVTDHLDGLLNNAGAGFDSPSAETLSVEALRATFETNVFGPFMVTQAFLPLLKRAKAARIVMCTSELGSLSFTRAWENLPAMAMTAGYCSSKTALNALTIQFAYALRKTPIMVNAVTPGPVPTDLSNHFGMKDGKEPPRPVPGLKTVDEGAAILVKYLTLAPGGPTGSYFAEKGVFPW